MIPFRFMKRYTSKRVDQNLIVKTDVMDHRSSKNIIFIIMCLSYK